MPQHLVSLAFDPASFETYMAASEANGGSRGELLRQAIQEWVDDGAPTEPILRRDFRVDASPERLVTVDVPLHLFTAIGQAQRTTGANRATVLRGILRWFFKKYEQEITFGTKPISSNRAAEAVPARPILNHFDEEDDGLDGFSFQPTNPRTFLNLPIANAPRVTIDDVHRLEQAVTRPVFPGVLERHGDLPSHDGYDSTRLAAIDAVFSANAHMLQPEHRLENYSVYCEVVRRRCDLPSLYPQPVVAVVRMDRRRLNCDKRR